MICLLIAGIIQLNKRSRWLKSLLEVCVLACSALNSSFRLNKELFKFFFDKNLSGMTENEIMTADWHAQDTVPSVHHMQF